LAKLAFAVRTAFAAAASAVAPDGNPRLLTATTPTAAAAAFFSARSLYRTRLFCRPVSSFS
jgi:hypothetical protein